MVNSVERTEKIKGKIENLGKYHAESGRIKSDLSLKTKISVFGVIDSGTDWYQASFNFYTDPQWQGDEKGFSTKVNYSFNTLNEIFNRVKKAEKSIEFLLSSATDHNWDVNSATDVIKCILSLEDQTQHLYEKRKEAAEKRESYVYGKNRD